jgi:hypothetical protein
VLADRPVELKDVALALGGEVNVVRPLEKPELSARSISKAGPPPSRRKSGGD